MPWKPLVAHGVRKLDEVRILACWIGCDFIIPYHSVPSLDEVNLSDGIGGWEELVFDTIMMISTTDGGKSRRELIQEKNMRWRQKIFPDKRSSQTKDLSQRIM